MFIVSQQKRVQQCDFNQSDSITRVNLLLLSFTILPSYRMVHFKTAARHFACLDIYIICSLQKSTVRGSVHLAPPVRDALFFALGLSIDLPISRTSYEARVENMADGTFVLSLPGTKQSHRFDHKDNSRRSFRRRWKASIISRAAADEVLSTKYK